MITAVGHSNHPVAANALEEVLAQCKVTFPDETPCLGILFTSRMDADFQAMLDRIMLEWPSLALVGCTTDGEISDIFPCVEHTICLLLLHSQKISFTIGLGENLSGDPEAAVRQASAAMNGNGNGKSETSPPRLGLVLAEGIKTFGTNIDKVLRDVLGERFPLFGGMAGDGYQMRTTFQFFNNRVVTDALILILVSGPVHFSIGLQSGFRPIGSTYAITRHTANVVWEIEGMPATRFLEQFLEQQHHGIAQFPLAVLGDDEGFYLRDPAFMNKENGSVTFVGTFPEHPRFRLTEFDRESFIENACQVSSEGSITRF